VHVADKLFLVAGASLPGQPRVVVAREIKLFQPLKAF